MLNLLMVVAGALILAYCSQHRIGVLRVSRAFYVDLAYVIMIVILSLFCGLRTGYNDTWTYISVFQSAPTLAEFFSEPINLLANPLYYFWQSFFYHHIASNYHLFFVVIAFFTIGSFVRFIRRNADNFIFSILLFFVLGLYLSTLAAVKQCIAMAILTYAVEGLMDRKYGKFYALVILAMLFHTYAIMFAILPLFTNKPWSAVTYLTIGAVAFVLFFFEDIITEFLEYADDMGKYIAEDQVLETAGINLFRLAVFAVPPLLSLVFQRWLDPHMNRGMSVMINMSILSFLVMCLGLSSGANLFGRSAIYFELGTIIALPWIIRQLFEKRSARLVTAVASLAYMGFFVFDNFGFENEYFSISFADFIRSLVG